MKKTHAEKTGSFLTYDINNNEYLVHEYTHYNDIQLPEKPPQKIPVLQFYKTDTGEHVRKRSNNKYIILTGYGIKNIEVYKAAEIANSRIQDS